MLRTASLVAMTLVLGWSSTALAQAFVEHLSPPVLQRGVVNRVEILGSETQGAVGLWSSLPAGVLQAKPVAESRAGVATFDVELSNQAPLGVYGLRLATRSGLSNVHLFVVDELPVTRMPDHAPAPRPMANAGINPAAPQPVKLPACITSTCQPAVVDRYAIHVEQGQRIGFEVVGNRLGKDYDPLLRIRNSAGRIVAECDNSVGLFFDCRFAHTFTAAGDYTIEVRDARYEGHPTWHYVLRMGDFIEARVAVPSVVRAGETTALMFPQVSGLQLPVSIAADRPLEGFFHEVRLVSHGLATWVPITVTDLPIQVEAEPNDTLEAATIVAAKAPATLNGVLSKRGDVDWFAFELAKDQKLTFQGFARTIGSPADLELIVFDADGREVRRVDDTDQDEASFAFNAGKAGVYRLQVRDVSRDGGTDFAYRVDVRAGGPQIQMLAEFPDITVPQGTYQPLPLKVTRTEFNGEIQLALRGSPAGITLEPNVIPAGATEFVARLVAAPDALQGLATLQVVGTAKVEIGPELTPIARTRPMIDRQLKNVDLIPYALREDQRHLPPSLTSQIALMVTPPAPFTLDLPEQLVKLTRYQTKEFPIVTTRSDGFAAPITFTVTGGQIGSEREERNQVYARFTPGTVDRLTTSGVFFNRILTQLNKHRVDLTASVEIDGQRINLIRTFTLDVQSAFKPTIEPELPSTEPGGSVKVKLNANRIETFDGDVVFTLGPQPGFTFPATVTIPKGQASVEVEFKADPKLNPGRHNVRNEVAGFVGKYEESFNLPSIPIEIKKPAK